MINQKKLAEISKLLTTNQEDFTSAFRQNLFTYLKDPDITLHKLSEEADVAYATLNSFLYGKSQNVRVDNVVKLAKALNVSVDELVGADTLHDLTKESLAMCRNLPENDLYLVRWFIRYLNDLNSKSEPNKRCISAIVPTLNNNGDFQVSANYEKIEITNLPEPLRSKIFVGCRIVSDYYMPHYIPGDIILIANDRPAKPNENVIVRVDKFLYIVNRRLENGISKFYSIRDGKYRIDESNVDELIGYIACKLNKKAGY